MLELSSNSPLFTRSVKQIDCGFCHSAIVTNLGEVFTCGGGDQGQSHFSQTTKTLSTTQTLDLEFNSFSFCWKCRATGAGEHRRPKRVPEGGRVGGRSPEGVLRVPPHRSVDSQWPHLELGKQFVWPGL